MEILLGAFDAVLVRQTVRTSGINGIALTKLDVEKGFSSLGYVYKDDASYEPKVRDMEYKYIPGPMVAALEPAPAASPPARRKRQPRLGEMFSPRPRQ